MLLRIVIIEDILTHPLFVELLHESLGSCCILRILHLSERCHSILFLLENLRRITLHARTIEDLASDELTTHEPCRNKCDYNYYKN